MPKLPVTVAAPLAAPTTVGWNIALIVQLAPGANVAAQVPKFAKANGPLMVNGSFSVRVEFPVLVNVEY